jgi:hypothetical protein
MFLEIIQIIPSNFLCAIWYSKSGYTKFQQPIPMNSIWRYRQVGQLNISTTNKHLRMKDGIYFYFFYICIYLFFQMKVSYYGR